MVFIAALTAGLIGGLGVALAWSIHAGWLAPVLSLDPKFISYCDSFLKIWGTAGGVMALLTLIGGYETRRLMIAIGVGAALAIPCAKWFAGNPQLKLLERPEWYINLSFFFGGALWFAFREPAEVTPGVGREEALLRSVYWLAFGVLLVVGFLLVPAFQTILSSSVVSSRSIEGGDVFATWVPWWLVVGSALLLCWLSWERYLLQTPMEKQEPVFLRSRQPRPPYQP